MAGDTPGQSVKKTLQQAAARAALVRQASKDAAAKATAPPAQPSPAPKRP